LPSPFLVALRKDLLDLSFYNRKPDTRPMSVFLSRIGEDGATAIFDPIARQTKDAGVLGDRIKAVDGEVSPNFRYFVRTGSQG